MYRVIAIVSGGLALAACSTSGDWLDAFKPAPAMDTVRFESEPPGADAKISTGQTCRTPCALALPATGSYTITFTLNGYQPDSEKIDAVSMGDGTTQLRPNPVLVELTPAPPPPKPKKKVIRKKPVAKKKPAPKPAAGASAAPPPAPAAIAPAPQAGPSPWPASPPPAR